MEIADMFVGRKEELKRFQEVLKKRLQLTPEEPLRETLRKVGDITAIKFFPAQRAFPFPSGK